MRADQGAQNFQEESSMKFCKAVLFMALMAAASLPAFSQAAMKIDVPFDFVAAGKAMPAGQYSVQKSFPENACAWTLQGSNTSATMLTNPLESRTAQHNLSLVFLNQGGKYFLAEIWLSGHAGRDVLRGHVRQTLVAQGGKYVEVGAE
jgi:hypothetical protein